MITYLALAIEAGRLSYTAVIARYPDIKDEIDTMLTADGYENLIVH